MSNALQKLDVVYVQDPLVRVNAKREYAVVKGGKQISMQQFSTNNVSNSSITWSAVNPPSNVLVSRKVYLTVPMRITLNTTGVAPGNLLNVGKDALRQFPLSAIIESINVKINGCSVSMQLGELIHPLMNYNTSSKLKSHDLSLSPSTPDQSQQYNDVYNSINSPLGFDGLDETQYGRATFPFNIVSNGPTQAVVDVVLTEPIFMNPMVWQHAEKNGFANIQTLDIVVNFFSNAWARVWSHNAVGANPITSGNIDFNQFAPAFSYSTTAPVALFKYITPQDIVSIPKMVTYDYCEVQRYVTQFNGIAAGTKASYPTSNIRLNAIPRRIYVFARPSLQSLLSSPSYTDSYCAISRISVNWNDRNSLLSNATQQQLYHMCRKNGLNMDWNNFSGQSLYQFGSFTNKYHGRGSVIAINPSTDLGLGPLECAGKLQDINLQIDVDVENISGQTMDMQIYVVTIMEGIINVWYGGAETQVGVLTSADILDAETTQASVSLEDVKDQHGAGNFFTGLSDALKQTKILSTVAKTAAPLLAATPYSAASPIVSSLGNIAEQYGYGEGEGVIRAGARMNKSSLKHRIKRF